MGKFHDRKGVGLPVHVRAYQSLLRGPVKDPHASSLKKSLMTIEQLAKRVIKEMKGWPEEAKQSQDVAGPKTCWDEFKEQVQYEEYDSFELFEEALQSMAMDYVSELSDRVINNLYTSIHKVLSSLTTEDKREVIVNDVYNFILSEAESQDIEYGKIEPDYVQYSVLDLTIVAELLSKVGPEALLICAYSEVTGDDGEQGVVNLSELADEDEFKWISFEEFENFKCSLKSRVVNEDHHEVNNDIPTPTEINDLKENLDQDKMLAGINLSRTILESGIKSFEDYTRAMIDDKGAGFKPFLKMFYSMFRYQPGFDTTDMDSLIDVDNADLDKILAGIK